MKRHKEESLSTAVPNPLDILEFVWKQVLDNFTSESKCFSLWKWDWQYEQIFFLTQGILQNIQFQQWMTVHCYTEDKGSMYLNNTANTAHINPLEPSG
jgi:hypothetical protein